MAGKIPQQFIDELLTRVDIVEIIDTRVPLKKAGRDYQACCPFHNEKTPSFTVSQTKQFYHCFGCGAHGTAIGFLMEYDRLEFVDAVKELAARVGLTVPQEAVRHTSDDRQDLYPLLEEAANYYKRQLREHPDSARAVDYLKGRGLSGNIAADFDIGFAPPGWDGLLQALGTDKARSDALLLTGMLIEKDTGGRYDRFRDRIMFPIRDRRGRVIGFGGRVLGDGTPKYLNSPETPVFHKGRELYGLYEARQHNRQLDRLLVVEGYMDVVALAQFEIRYAVATLGTATTREHLETLFRAAAETVFCFDGDRAGRAAAWRALETCMPLMHAGRQVRFLFLPDGEDPDTLVRKEGRAAFEARLDQALPLSEFLYEELAGQVDMGSVDGRARLVELARPLLARLPDDVYRTLLLDQLGKRVHLSGEKLAQLLGPGTATTTTAAPSRRAALTRRTPVRTAIGLLLQRPSLAQQAGDPAELKELSAPGSDLLVQLLEWLQANPACGTGAVLERWRETPEGPALFRLAEWEPDIPEDGMAQEFDDTLRRLRSQAQEQRTEMLYRKDFKLLTPEEKAELQRLLAARNKPA